MKTPVLGDLVIRNASVTSDDGIYSCYLVNLAGSGAAGNITLTVNGVPDRPQGFRVSHTNAVSITMQWTSGWNTGGEQVFTLMYKRSDSDDSYTSITDISDPGQYDTVTSKAAGLLPDTSYDFLVQAINKYGASQSQLVTHLTIGKAAEPLQLEEYAQVDFSKKNGKEAAGKGKPPVKEKKPKPEASPPRPPREASVDEGERAQSPPDHQQHYGVEGTLYADLDLINTRPTRTEPTVHANLEPSEYASIDALRLTTRPADQ